MIPAKNTDLVTQGNIGQFDSIEMGLDPDGTAHIIGLLTDLYGDTILACVREYSSNARDAQIEAGVDAPIEVNLPGPLSPLFTVRDSGVGLGRDEIANIYSKYGASTKRDTNAQNGMLGLGCKAGLTYASQFTVVSVKDGIRTTAIVSRKDDDLPTITIVDETPVDLPSGTEIQVPVRQPDIRYFEAKAREFFGFWEDGEALIGGRPNERVKGLAIGDELLVTEAAGYRGHKLVMGGVAYPADLKVHLPYGKALVAFVPIGSVRFAPSREVLMTTASTRATLAQVEMNFRDQSVAAVQTAIDAEATSHIQAVKIASEWARCIPGVKRTQLTYKGAAIPELHHFPDAGATLLVPVNGHKVTAHRKIQNLSVADFSETVFVYGYDRASFTATQKKKLIQWLAEVKKPESGAYPKQFILCAPKPASPWLEGATFVPWGDVHAQKLPTAAPAARASGRIPGSYDFYEGEVLREGVVDTEIDTGLPLHYFVGRPHEALPYVSMLMATNLDAFTIVVLGQGRVVKFLRNFPQATSIVAEVRGLFDAWAAQLTSDQRRALSMSDAGATGIFEGLDAALFDDPAIKEAVRISGIDIREVSKRRNVFHYATRSTLDGPPRFSNPLARYPLTQGGYCIRHNLEHVAIYINAVYAAK